MHRHTHLCCTLGTSLKVQHAQWEWPLSCSDTPTKEYLPKFLSPSILRSKLSKRSS